MVLKSIELLGFKSFADRTRIEFANGIAAFVGPNGCGKSNIVDAIKWVFGEQAVKSLRADRMDDLIFGGTETRQALNVSEVTLTIENAEEMLQLGVSELSIKRRVFRSGESEYFINNTPVRLREIRELFFDTGLGKTSYSIMEQGKIDQILSNKPEDRRYLFEEAAGITKYHARRLEADRNLGKTEENLRHVDTILKEVKKSHETLQEQAKKAEQYRELRERIFQVELHIQLSRLRDVHNQRDQKDSLIAKQSEKRIELQAKIEEITQKIGKDLETVNDMESRLIEIQNDLYRCDVNRERNDDQIRLFNERSSELLSNRQYIEARQHAIETKIKRIEEDSTQRSKSLKEIVSRTSEIEANIKDFEQDISHFSERIQSNESEIGKIEGENSIHEKNLEKSRADLRAITDDIVTQLDKRLKESSYSSEERKSTEDSMVNLFKSLKIQLDGKKTLLDDALLIREQARKQDYSLLSSTSDFFEELQQKLETLHTHFLKYRTFTPSFLEEFTAPAGIITRKREIDNDIGARMAEITTNRERIKTLRKDNEKASSKLEQYRRTLHDLRLNRVQLNAQRASLQNEIDRLIREKEEQANILNDNEREKRHIVDRSIEIDNQIAAIEKQNDSILKNQDVLRTDLDQVKNEITQKNSSVVSTRKLLTHKTDELEQLRSYHEVLNRELTELTTIERNIHDNFRERFSRDLSEFEATDAEIDESMADLREKLSRLREELRNIGRVNLMAPEEFAEVNERYEFLNSQIMDLREARENLRQVTKEITRESSKLYTETYETIKQNFNMVFRQLFGGGRGELRLEEPEDILESGIEIFVQPPGKKLENLSLLSGGERSLTAVALLFAIYMVRPSPFCVLDEIDAALDEENVGRFLHLLKEFTNTSQFIIITHNKKTVANAETLYGVTMEEPGVTKLITIKVKEHIEEKTYA